MKKQLLTGLAIFSAATLLNVYPTQDFSAKKVYAAVMNHSINQLNATVKPLGQETIELTSEDAKNNHSQYSYRWAGTDDLEILKNLDGFNELPAPTGDKIRLTLNHAQLRSQGQPNPKGTYLIIKKRSDIVFCSKDIKTVDYNYKPYFDLSKNKIILWDDTQGQEYFEYKILGSGSDNKDTEGWTKTDEVTTSYDINPSLSSGESKTYLIRRPATDDSFASIAKAVKVYNLSEVEKITFEEIKNLKFSLHGDALTISGLGKISETKKSNLEYSFVDALDRGNAPQRYPLPFGKPSHDELTLSKIGAGTRIYLYIDGARVVKLFFEQKLDFTEEEFKKVKQDGLSKRIIGLAEPDKFEISKNKDSGYQDVTLKEGKVSVDHFGIYYLRKKGTAGNMLDLSDLQSEVEKSFTLPSEPRKITLVDPSVIEEEERRAIEEKNAKEKKEEEKKEKEKKEKEKKEKEKEENSTEHRVKGTKKGKLVESMLTVDSLIASGSSVSVVNDGKLAYTVRTEEKLSNGQTLKVFEYKNGHYVLVNGESYLLGENGFLLSLPEGKDYVLLSEESADKKAEEIRTSLKLKSGKLRLNKNGGGRILFDKDFDRANIKKVKYSYQKSSLKISKKGYVLAKKQGVTLPVKVTVTLKDNTKKVLKLEVLVK